MSELEKLHASIVWWEECWIPVFARLEEHRLACMSYIVYAPLSQYLAIPYLVLFTDAGLVLLYTR